MGLVRYRAQDDQEADAEEAAGGQDGVAQTNARPHCQDRSMVEADAQRAPELLCGFRKQPEPVVVLQRGAMALAQVAQTTQPACIHELGEVHQRHRPLLPVDQDTASTACVATRGRHCAARQMPQYRGGASCCLAAATLQHRSQYPDQPRLCWSSLPCNFCDPLCRMIRETVWPDASNNNRQFWLAHGETPCGFDECLLVGFNPVSIVRYQSATFAIACHLPQRPRW